MNNVVFRKTMQNIRKHRNIKLVTNQEAYLKAVMKPNFKSGALFSENLMGCEMGKIKVAMNKPVYLGQAILDLSKTVMYEFHYDYMKQKYPMGLTLYCMDTGSLIYDIETDDFYKDIAEDVKDRFDMSGYNPNRPLPVGLNKKVIGLMKDELGGEIMTEFVTLRPKMHAYKTGSAESKKCKGIKKCVVRKAISFKDYKACLFGGGLSYRSQLMFRSSKHALKVNRINKLVLSRDGDKCITINGINSLARCESVARESCRIVPKVNGKKLKAEDFELVKDSKVGRNVYTKIYTKKSGKVKCRISLSPKDTIPIDKLVDENFEGSCILRLYHAYLGSTKSITLSVEEILVKKMDIMESYFDDLSDESDSEDDE